ncbi:MULTISPECIES: exodeoxyribonuclease VII small subunit [unclassified Frankia]|uniref:exodeoxyribonuclease VII small subunit n=1 Tax=unclassified Frankia TaxID=2632575 RepID=UPI001EF68020|nr:MULTISPECIES: exodeoxyribonuclease VII small subunit [unclassified Frankia]
MSGSQDAPPAHEASPTYERARAELEEVVHRLEAGGITLEESLTLWERGEALTRTCQAFLDGARARLDTARHTTAPASGGQPEDAQADA